MNLDEIKAFHRVSKIVESLLEKFGLKTFIPFAISYLYKNKEICLQVDKLISDVYESKD